MMPALGAGGRWFESGRPHISVSISIQMSRNCYTPPFQRCELEEKNLRYGSRSCAASRNKTLLANRIYRQKFSLDISLVVTMLMVYVVNINTSMTTTDHTYMNSLNLVDYQFYE